MSTENLSAWGRGLLPPVPTATQVRAALLILSEPLSAEIPPRDLNPLMRGPMTPASMPLPTNPEHEKWIQNFYDRVRALCVVQGIRPAESGDIDWMGLALRLIFDYVPRDDGDPRIKLKRKAGAKPKHSTWQAKTDRRDLLKIVEMKLAANPRLSVSDIAVTVSKKKEQKNLPARFQGKSAETLRKQIALARQEGAFEQMVGKTYAELLGYPPAPIAGTGEGLRFRPEKKSS